MRFYHMLFILANIQYYSWERRMYIRPDRTKKHPESRILDALRMSYINISVLVFRYADDLSDLTGNLFF